MGLLAGAASAALALGALIVEMIVLRTKVESSASGSAGIALDASTSPHVVAPTRVSVPTPIDASPRIGPRRTRRSRVSRRATHTDSSSEEPNNEPADAVTIVTINSW